MKKIYIARHGQDLDNEKGLLNGHRDKPLTELGMEQAENLGAKLQAENIKIDFIYSSPLLRAYQTATIISQKLGLCPVEKIPDLIERDFGSMTGKEIKDIDSLCSPNILKTATITYILNPDDGESFPQALIRAQKVLDFLAKESKAENILLATHGDIGKMLYAAFYHMAWKEVLSLFHFGNSELLLLADGTPLAQRHLFKTAQHNL